MAICNFDGCEREVFEKTDQCALHVEKNDYSQDWNSGLLEEFYNQFIEHILDYFWDQKQIPKNRLRESLKGTVAITQPQHQNLLIKLSDIRFPKHDNRDIFDYERILKKMESIYFDLCHFYTSDIDLGNSKLFYQDCVFKDEWTLRKNPILNNVFDYQYQSCEFQKMISNDESTEQIENNLFIDCSFKENVSLKNVFFKKSLLKYSNTDKQITIPRLELSNCIFEDKVFNIKTENLFSVNKLFISKCRFENDFILSNTKLDSFTCENSAFNDRFYFQKNKVKKLVIEKVSFNRPSDLTLTHFGELQIKDSTFKEYVYMNECEFGTSELLDDKNSPAIFVNVNFMSFINFRKANFISGLSIRDVNFNDAPNFLNVFISDLNTDRETYRIVKNSFDRIQNYIEANEYYQKEMLKWREELKLQKGKWSLRILLFLYAKFSNYGLDFIKPIMWIFILAGLYTLIIEGYENNWLYPSWSPFNSHLNYVFSFLNKIASNIIPFNRWVYSGIEFISILVYILFASLIWLVILAIKRNTKR